MPTLRRSLAPSSTRCHSSSDANTTLVSFPRGVEVQSECHRNGTIHTPNRCQPDSPHASVTPTPKRPLSVLRTHSNQRNGTFVHGSKDVEALRVPTFHAPSPRTPTRSLAADLAGTEGRLSHARGTSETGTAVTHVDGGNAISTSSPCVRYPPPRGRTEDQVMEDRVRSSASRAISYPPPRNQHDVSAEPHKNVVERAETRVQKETPDPEKIDTRKLHSQSSSHETTEVATQGETPTCAADSSALVLPRLPLSIHGRLYFELKIDTTTKHASSGILVVRTEPDFGMQMYDREGRCFGKATTTSSVHGDQSTTVSNWYPLLPQTVEKLVAPSEMVLFGRKVTLVTAVREDAFRSGAFFLDSQRAAKERRRKELQEASRILDAAIPKKKSVLLSSAPVVRSRCGLRGGAPGRFVVPFKGLNRDRSVSTGGLQRIELRACHDPDAERAVVLYYASYKMDLQGRSIVSVVVDPVVGSKLRPHQVEGVRFMYECVTGQRLEGYHGCILADEMGLGKSIQAVTLIWTCLRQGMYGRPLTRRAMVIAPCSLVANWVKEFNKWIGEGVVKLCAISESTPKGERILSRFESEGDVLVISYDQLRKYVDRIAGMQHVDLVVCDEGHKLKNAAIQTSKAVFRVPTLRRVILSGTPIQNDLSEFHAMVSFINPGVLGELESFCRVFQEPILRGREPCCSEEEKLLGQDRAHFLSTLTSKFILRRKQTLNEKYLPAKVEMSVFCSLTPTQLHVYRKLTQERESGTVARQAFAAITALRQLSNHLALLVADSPATQDRELLHLLPSDIREYIRRAPPSEMSGKQNVLLALVQECHKVKDKIVVVSNFTQTLTLLAQGLRAMGCYFFQLDGATPIKKRQEFVDQFNAVTSRETVFLLSSKAGGVGLNLIGANRLVLFDPDWNPANDAQAMGRVWRDGQSKTVFIYRFLSTGTIEEKIYMRQVSKQGLSANVVDASTDSKQHFSIEDLRTLFVLKEGTLCETHDLLQCRSCAFSKAQHVHANDPRGSGNTNKMKFKPIGLRREAGDDNHPGPRMDELKAWNHMEPSDVHVFDPLFHGVCTQSKAVTFLFVIAREPEKISGNQVEREKQFEQDKNQIVVDDESDAVCENEIAVTMTQPESECETSTEVEEEEELENKPNKRGPKKQRKK